MPARSSTLQSAAVPEHLGRTAARGLVWMMSQTVGVKIVSLIANVLLAYFVAPGDAGLVSMSYTVLAIAGIVQFIGLQDVLVQRQAKLRRWVNPAFWMSLAVGLVGGGIVALAAPLAAAFYHEPRLTGLVLLLALASPFQSIGIVPQAIMASHLRFRMLVVINTAASIGISAFSVALAWLGFGAYSFLIPVPVVAAIQSAVTWWIAAPPTIQWSPQFKRWTFLLGDATYNWGISICFIVITTADHIVLGRFFSKDVLGIYFWAVNLSTQLLRLLATNLMGVLLPSLSKLQSDPDRQTAAFLEAARVLAIVGIPACLLQAALAQPLVRVLYTSTWAGVGPVLAALSVGLALYFVSGPAVSMMKAQGRFKAAFALHLVHAMVMVTVVLIVAMSAEDQSAALMMAAAVATCLAAFGPLYLRLALQRTRHGWRAVGSVYAGPVLASVLAIALGVVAAAFIPAMPGRDVFVLGVTTFISAAAYLIIIRAVDKPGWEMMVMRLNSLWRRRTWVVDVLPRFGSQSSEVGGPRSDL
jgi:O-antigen/teichoic acid export membrane protein